MDERRTGIFDNALIWFGAGVSIAEILSGTYLAPLGFGKGLLSIFAGHIIGCFLLFLAGCIGGKRRMSAMETATLSFGNRGAFLFAALNVLQLVGWTAIMIYDGALAANGALSCGRWIWALVIGGLIILWISIGIQSLGKVNVIAMSALFILTVILSAVIFRKGDLSAPAAGGMSFGAAMELSVAMPLSWLPLISDYTREAEEPVKASAWSAAVYGLVSCWMYIIGMGAALLTGTGDIAESPQRSQETTPVYLAPVISADELQHAQQVADLYVLGPVGQGVEPATIPLVHIFRTTLVRRTVLDRLEFFHAESAREIQEQPLEHGSGLSECQTAFPGCSGRCHTVADLFDEIFASCDVSACQSQSAAWILDQGSCHNVRTNICRLFDMQKLPIAVIHKTDELWVDSMHKGSPFFDELRIDAVHEGSPFFDLLDRDGFSPAVSGGTLQTDHSRIRRDGFCESIKINSALRSKFHLVICNAEILEGAFAVAAYPDGFFQRIIRSAGAVDHFIAGSQNACESKAERVGTIDDDRPDKGCFRMEHVCEQAFCRISAHIIIAIACVPGEMPVADTVLLECVQNLVLVVSHNVIQLIEKRTDFLLTGVYKVQDLL